MEDYVEKIVGKHYVGIIHRDTDAWSWNPMEEFDFLGKLYVPNCRYLSSTCDEEYFNSSAVKVPVYMYSHSGVTINTTGFSCPWDSGQIGWICVSKDDALEAYCRKRFSSKLYDKISEHLISEIQTIDNWLTGEVYGYTIHKLVDNECDEPYEEDSIDSCWGFYGLDWCRETVNDILKQYDNDREN